MLNNFEINVKPLYPQQNPISSVIPEQKWTLEQIDETTKTTSLLQVESSVPTQAQASSIEEDWNSLFLLARTTGTAEETSLKQTSESVLTLEKSFSAMVMAFLMACLDIFSSIQKSQMAMALQQLDIMVSQIKLQIAELKKEQEDQLVKDCFQAATEMAGSIISVVGSAKTTLEMNTKLDLQKHNATNMKGAIVNEKLDKLNAEVKIANAQTRDAASTKNGVSNNVLDNANSQIDQLADGTNRVNFERGNINSSAPLRDVNTYKLNGELLASEVNFINNKQSLLNSVAGLTHGLIHN